jgi:hypothetical protein
MLLISAVFALIVGVTYFIPVVLPVWSAKTKPDSGDDSHAAISCSRYSW